MSRPYRTSCDDFTPPSGADALSADDLAALLGRPPGKPWMRAADATHGDVAGEFEVATGHVVTMRSAAGDVTVTTGEDASHALTQEGACPR